MNVFINNEPKDVQNQITINQLLRDLNLSSAKGIAVAINNQVVPRLTWDKFNVTENDKVTIIKATQGG
jgi:sulfur carrier protein